MAPHSMDLRTRVLADCDAGLAAKDFHRPLFHGANYRQTLYPSHRCKFGKR